MKSTIYSFVTLFIFMLITPTLQAQDVIHLKKKQESIEAKIMEIGTGEVKYRLWAEKEDGVIYVLEKRNITHIKFENGRTEYFGQETIDEAEYFAGQDKRALKISFLAPLTGSTTFTYEQNIKPGRSWEARAAIIGLGFNREDRDARGFIGTIGYKFYKKPTFITSDTRRRHILQGGYIKPELFVGNTTFNTGILGTGDQRKSETTVGLLLNLGVQWILGDSFLINIVGGIGYGGGDSHRMYRVDDDSNFAGTFSVDIGFTF